MVSREEMGQLTFVCDLPNKFFFFAMQAEVTLARIY